MARERFLPALPSIQAAVWFALSGLALAQNPPAALDLRNYLPPDAKASSVPAIANLAPEWVGEIRDGDKTLHLRVDHMGGSTAVGKEHGTGRLWIARMSDAGGFVGNERAEFHPALPTIKEIKEAKTLAQLRGWFGVQPGWTDGWGDENLVHSSESWGCFTRTPDGNLRWLHVFAHTTFKTGDGEKDELIHIESVSIAEGILRPANPDSKEEKERYPNAAQLADQEEKKKAAKRAKLPEPLRSLVAADEAPNDSDLTVYKASLEKIRRNPEPALFRQIAAFDEDGTGHSYLRDIFDQRPPYDAVEAWTDENRKKAIRFAVEALPASNSPDKLEHNVIELLQAMGGGHVVIDEPKIDLLVPKGKEGAYTQSRWWVDKKNQSKAAAALVEWFGNHP